MEESPGITGVLCRPRQEKGVDLFGQPEGLPLVKDRLGFLPLSVWRATPQEARRRQTLKEMIGDGAENRHTSAIKYQTADSVFDPILAERIFRAYGPGPGSRVLDPFAGGGVRACVAAAMGYEYHGVELRAEEVAHVNATLNRLRLEADIEQGDAREMAVPESSFDFCLTCPPYFDVEQYNGGPADLSMLGSYEDFRRELRKVIACCSAALRKGAFCCWIVGDFRAKGGELIPFHGHVAEDFEREGLALHDVIVWDKGTAGVSRVGNFMANRRSVRTHEYVIVGKKKLRESPRQPRDRWYSQSGCRRPNMQQTITGPAGGTAPPGLFARSECAGVREARQGFPYGPLPPALGPVPFWES